MAANTLTKKWIQYLKNNQIVAMQSDPKSGRLNYRKKVTVDDLIHFLQNDTDYSDTQIDKAIDTVLTKKPKATQNLPATVGNNQPAATNNKNLPPSKMPQIGVDNIDVGAPRQKKYDNTGDITDVEPRYSTQQPQQQKQNAIANNAPRNNPTIEPEQGQEKKKRTGGKQAGVVSQTPNAIRKRAERARKRANGTLEEDFVDDPGEELDEKDVEDVFNLLGKSKDDTSPEDLEKLKNLITNKMDSTERKSLWDLINKDNVAESVFVYSSVNLPRTKITLENLRSDWQKSGYTSDSVEIANILIGRGYSERQILAAFNRTLTEDSSNADSKYSETIAKIAEYILSHNLKDAIVDFMQKNFADDIKEPEPEQGFMGKFKNFAAKTAGSAARGAKNVTSNMSQAFNAGRRKFTNEDVKQIFTILINEEQQGISELNRINEHTQLGRNKKTAVAENSIHDVLKADQYVTILRHLNTKAKSDINVTRIKNQVLKAWSKGMKSRKHYDKLLHSVHVSLSDLIDK